jgi:hypothetical protein
MYSSSMRWYCLPGRAAVLLQDHHPAVKAFIFLEFLGPTFNIEQSSHFPLHFKLMLCVDGDWYYEYYTIIIFYIILYIILWKILSFHSFIENQSCNKKRHNERRMQNNQNKYALNNTVTVIWSFHRVLVEKPGLPGCCLMRLGDFFSTFRRYVPPS